jgi:hypothetical protein
MKSGLKLTKKKLGVGIVAIIIVVALFIYIKPRLAQAITQLSSWSGVQASSSAAGQQTIVRTSNGTMIAFFSNVYALYYSTSTDGVTWSTAIGVSGGSVYTGNGYAVVIDSSDNIYISYVSPQPMLYVMKYAFSGGVLGTGTVVLSVSGTTSKPILAVNSSGAVVVNAAGSTTTVSYITTNGGTGWSSAYTLDSSAATAAPLIAIGQAFYTLNNSNTILKDTTGAGAWTSTGVTVSSATGKPSLASTSSDAIDMIYQVSGSTVSYQRYTISTNSLGGVTGLAGSVSTNGYSLTAAADGQMWAFYSLSNGHVAYVHYDGSSWDGTATDLGANPSGGSLVAASISSALYMSSTGFLSVEWVTLSTSSYYQYIASLNVTVSLGPTPTPTPTPSPTPIPDVNTQINGGTIIKGGTLIK